MPKRIDLEVTRLALLQQLAPEFVGDVQMFEDFTRQYIAVRFEREVYSHKLAEHDIRLEVPINWWQHLRSQLGLRYKSRVRTGTVVRRRTYPDIPVLPSRYGASFLREDPQ